MTPLTIKTMDVTRFEPGSFPFQVNQTEMALYIPSDIARTMPDFVEGDNAMPFIERLWFFPRETAGSLHWNVSDVQNAARILVHNLVSQKLLDPTRLSFWDLGYEKPATFPQPALF